MVSWLAKQLLSRVLARTRAGDLRAILWLDSPNVKLVFPGDNSWGGTVRGKDEHRRWLERLVRVGVKLDLDEVVAGGLPWRMTVCIRGRSWLDSPDAERVYDNRYVIWARLRWGRLLRYEVYEDTEKTAALDRYLATHEPRLAQP